MNPWLKPINISLVYHVPVVHRIDEDPLVGLRIVPLDRVERRRPVVAAKRVDQVLERHDLVGRPRICNVITNIYLWGIMLSFSVFETIFLSLNSQVYNRKVIFSVIFIGLTPNTIFKRFSLHLPSMRKGSLLFTEQTMIQIDSLSLLLLKCFQRIKSGRQCYKRKFVLKKTSPKLFDCTLPQFRLNYGIVIA